MEPSWRLLNRTSNWQHNQRLDQICLEFKNQAPRRDITEGYYSAHESRFVKSDCNLIKANDPDIFEIKIGKFA